MVICVLVPRFALLAALRAWSTGARGADDLSGEPPASLLSEPVALGPAPGGVQTVGDASPAAEAFGVTAGMRMGEALARCPELRLVPPDPDAVRAGWGKVLDRLERIGAAPGAVRAFLAPLEVGVLRVRPELAELPEVLEQLGVRTLGELAELPAPAVAERFGHPGLLALELAHGRDTPLTPRRPPEPVVERLDLPEATSGMQLERALALLVARVLARPERRGRSLRSLVLSARFVEGGAWRARATLRQASADSERLRLALAPRLGELPAPAESLAVEVEAFGPPAHDQERLVHDEDSAAAERRARLGEAVRQVRAAAGEGAALRALEVDPRSRVPERRTVLAPFPAEESASGGRRVRPRGGNSPEGSR